MSELQPTQAQEIHEALIRRAPAWFRHTYEDTLKYEAEIRSNPLITRAASLNYSGLPETTYEELSGRSDFRQLMEARLVSDTASAGKPGIELIMLVRALPDTVVKAYGEPNRGNGPVHTSFGRDANSPRR